LNSSLAQLLAGYGHIEYGYNPGYQVTKSCFLAHDFEFRYARKSIKGSKVANFILVSKKNLSQKMAYSIGAQGQVRVTQKR